MKRIRKFLMFLLDNIEKYENRVEAINDVESSYFIKNMPDTELDEAIASGENFLRLANVVLEHQRLLTKEFILDPEDPKYKNLDPRSLNFMLEEMFLLYPQIIGELKSEQKKRDEKIKREAEEKKPKK